MFPLLCKQMIYKARVMYLMNFTNTITLWYSWQCMVLLCHRSWVGIVTGSFCKQHIVLNHVFFRYKSSGGKIRGTSGGRGVLPFHVGRTWFRLAVTSANRFLPVVAHDLKGIAWLVASLQIRNSNNADVLLDSGLNLFDIMANLCSKLCCEVLLKSWNYIVYLLKWTSALDFNKRGCVRQI